VPAIDLLVDLGGKLAEATVIGQAAKIRQLLERAGFTVIEVRARDVITLQPISCRDAGALRALLPPSVVASW
jgi:hypothetical protein